MYWSIYAIDPNALTPRDFIYPLVLNNMHHTLPWILSLIQMFIFVKREINSFSLKIDVAKANEIGMVTLFIVSVLYAVAAATKKLITGKFPYPFLNDLNRIQYAVFNMFSIAFGLMMSNISTQILFKVARTMKKQAAVDKSNWVQCLCSEISMVNLVVCYIWSKFFVLMLCIKICQSVNLLMFWNNKLLELFFQVLLIFVVNS